MAKCNLTLSTVVQLLTVYSRLSENVKLQVAPDKAIKAHRRYSRISSLILMSGEWSKSRSVRFTPKELAPSVHCTGGSVDSRTCLHDLDRRNVLYLHFTKRSVLECLYLLDSGRCSWESLSTITDITVGPQTNEPPHFFLCPASTFKISKLFSQVRTAN